MRLQKPWTIPEHTKMVLDKTVCDICGANVEDYKDKGSWWQSRIEVRLVEGDAYPEGGFGTEIEVDLCRVCFREKLVPWLESMGAKVQERECDI